MEGTQNHRGKQKRSLEPRRNTENRQCRDVHKWPMIDCCKIVNFYLQNHEQQFCWSTVPHNSLEPITSSSFSNKTVTAQRKSQF